MPRGGMDFLERRPRRSVGDSRGEKLAVPIDHEELVVEIVCHTAGETADGFHLPCLQELILELPLFADVAVVDDDRADSGVVEQVGERYVQPQPRTVRMTLPELCAGHVARALDE